MAAPKKLTAQQQRDRRAKIMLAVLGCVLLLVVGLQAPKLMHSGGGSSATPPPSTTAASAALAAAPVAIPPAAGQLQHFSRFKAKDPFKAVVAAPKPGAATTAPDAAKKPAAAARVDKPAAAKTPLTLTVSKTAPAVPTGPRVPAAVLMVNGKRQVVALDTPFPAKHPVFKVVAVGGKTVWLQLIGGSLGNGSQTVKLVHGQKITLVNSTVNFRLVLALVKPTTAPKPAVVPPAAAQPAPATTTTPAAPATTTTAG